VHQPPAALAHRAGHAWEQAVLPLAARGAELLLSPANTAPLAARRNIVVVHDTAPFQDPSWYGRAYGAWHRALIPRLVRRARLVVTPSDFVRGELAERFGVPADRLRAVPPGVDPAFGAPPDPAPLLRRLGLERPYVLAVGTDSPRKNLGLLETIAPALDEAGFDTVIAGSVRAYLPASAPGRARRLGYVADSDLPALYAGAAVFAMPSLYEGFGLPCVEAMAAGTPVVASARAALLEACGGAALFADPADPDGFTGALLLAAGRERERLRAAGRQRAAELTWDRTAQAVDSALEPLLSATGRRR
jgi:glycosyltransferase involved in cell wall biosynthesis